MDHQTTDRGASENRLPSAFETVIVVAPACGAIDAFIHRALGAQCARNQWKIRESLDPVT